MALNPAGRLDLTDYGEARFRAGYVVGNLLPYGFIGMAVGRASYSVVYYCGRGASYDWNRSLPNGHELHGRDMSIFPNSAGTGQYNALLWGYTVGAGLDWALTPNIFVRGEFEFVQFAPISSIAVSVASGRLGGGFKF